MPIEDFIITVFCLIDDECKKIAGGNRLRTRGFEPKLSDSEVITMDVVGEFLGKDTDTRDLWHLTNRIGRKVLAHTVGILGNPPLQFECLGIV